MSAARKEKAYPQTSCFSQQKTYFTGSRFDLLEAHSLDSFFIHVETCTLRLDLSPQVEHIPAEETPPPQHAPTEDSRIPLTTPVHPALSAQH